MADTRFFPLAAAQLNLQRLLLIRLIVYVCQLSALAFAWFLDYSLEYTPIISVMGFILVINAWAFFRLLHQSMVSDQEFLLHLLFDVLSLSVLLYFGGGASNPFVSFFLVPITISAAILPWTYTWAVAGISLACYTFLLFFYRPLSILMPEDMNMSSMGGLPNLHIIGMWCNFIVSAVLITYFVVKMAAEIRSQDIKLNDYREDNMRNEQILAVATQAAGTAHELGTPLNTMTILVRQMADDYQENPALAKDIATLEMQLASCKASLQEMVKRADLRNAGMARQSAIPVFIEQILEQWSLLRPEVRLNQKYIAANESPQIHVDSTLQQAIVNILNNAADASPEGIDLAVDWNTENWTLTIRDYGKGVDEEMMAYLGSEIVSNKEKGMGVGMILSQASIERMGGEVSISSHPEQGTLTQIRLPVLNASAQTSKQAEE
ncbi:MAG: ATP-binding protein [Gammaproteobacteria bacterium]|nr:ATP-binding protein [Gammaproteobacteria bacterium]